MKRFIPNKIKQLFIKVLLSHSTTQEIADGLAIGIFIAFLPIMGLQMYVSFALTSLFRKNTWVALLAAWVTNPLTAFPIYLFNLWVGKLVYHKNVSFSEIEGVVASLDFSNILTSGKEILIPLWIGSVIVGVVAAFLSQQLCLRYYDRIKARFIYLAHNIELPHHKKK